VTKRITIGSIVTVLALVATSLAACSDKTAVSPQPTGRNASPAATAPAWPLLGHDPQRSGRSPYSGPSSPTESWTVDFGSYQCSSPTVGVDGTLYVGSSDGRLTALNTDGSTRWTFQADGQVGTPTIGPDGTLYVGTWRGDTGNNMRGSLYAIRPNGTQKWRFPAGDWVDSSPVLGPDGAIYVSSGGTLYAIASSGKQKWSSHVGGETTSATIGTDGTVYFATSYWMVAESDLYAMNRDGTQTWTFKADGIVRTPVIGPDGTIYALCPPVGGGGSSTLHALRPDGTQAWQYTIEDHVMDAPGVASDGTIYLASDGGVVFALSPDGDKKWERHVGGIIECSPTIAADGTVYVLGDELIALSSNGDVRWRTAPDEYVYSSATIGANGVLYVAGSSTLKAIGDR